MAQTKLDLRQRTATLQEYLKDARSNVSIDSLLDTIIALYADLQGLKDNKNAELFNSKCQWNSFFFLRAKIKIDSSLILVHLATQEIQRKRLNPDDFQQIQILGRGAFGTVQLVRQKDTGNLFAMKTLNKFEMVQKWKKNVSSLTVVLKL